MTTKTCSYCTDPSIGTDEDGEPTCGDSSTCTAVATCNPGQHDFVDGVCTKCSTVVARGPKSLALEARGRKTRKTRRSRISIDGEDGIDEGAWERAMDRI